MTTIGAVMIEDTAARLYRGIEQAGERPRFLSSFHVAYFCYRARLALSKRRRHYEKLQALEWDGELHNKEAADIADKVERFASPWDSRGRKIFQRRPRLRWVVPLIDSYAAELEDYEETLALASSERFCGFVVRSVDAARCAASTGASASMTP